MTETTISADAGLPPTRSLLLVRDGSRVDVTLNMPEVRNALSAQMWAELDAVFAALRDDRGVRVIVLRGAGGHFSAGGNTKERSAIGSGTGDVGAIVERNKAGGEVLARIDRAPQVVVAVVQGYALGGGLGLSCVADIVIADETASFRLPEAGIGVIPAQIAPYLVRRVGLSQARRLALTAATVRGPEAAALGLVHHLCEGVDALDRQIAEVLAQIDRCGPHALAATKGLLREAQAGGDGYIDAAARLFANAFCSEEGQEGASALRERRRPSWQREAA